MSLISLSQTPIDVQRAIPTYDAEGMISHTWTTIYHNIMVQGPQTDDRPEEYSEFAQRAVKITHLFYSSAALGLIYDDKILFNGKTFLVRYEEDQAGRGRVFCIHTQLKGL